MFVMFVDSGAGGKKKQGFVALSGSRFVAKTWPAFRSLWRESGMADPSSRSMIDECGGGPVGSGAERVTKMAEWPDWNPPEEMIVRQPYLPLTFSAVIAVPYARDSAAITIWPAG
jgi:hypothetical protein